VMPVAGFRRCGMVRRLLLWSATGLLLLPLSAAMPAQAGTSGATVASPAVTGPIAGTPILFGPTAFDLGTVGYTQSEFFVSGTANAFTPTAALTTDGRWAVAPSAQAAYTTRIVVNQPADRRKFNGSVVVEWLNVSGGVDASPDWIHMHDELIRD